MVSTVGSSDDFKKAIDTFGDMRQGLGELLSMEKGHWGAPNEDKMKEDEANEYRDTAIAMYSTARRDTLLEVRAMLQSRIANFPHFDEEGKYNVLAPGNHLACTSLTRWIDGLIKEMG